MDAGGQRMDPTGLDAPRGGREPDGFDPAPRLNFVPPPEVPTPEYATVEARAKALAIDALLGIGGVILLGIVFGGVGPSNGLLWITIGGPPLIMATVLWLVYMTLMEVKYGASVGKRVRGLRVVMEDGSPVTHEAALMRNLLRFLDAAPYVVPYYVGARAAKGSPKLQRFGDRVAETMVVAAPAPDSAEALALEYAPPASDAAPAASRRRRGRLLVVGVAILLLVVAGGAAVFLMWGPS